MRSPSSRFSSPGRGFSPVRRAFSMVEVIVVMTIIAIGTTIGLYSYASFRENIGIDTSISIVNQYMIQAKNLAINKGVSHQLVVDLDSENIWINRLDDLGNIDASRVVENKRMPDEVEINSISVNGVPARSGVVSVNFDPDGTNPLIIININRGNLPLDPPNIAAIRLYPISSETQVVRGQHLL